MKKSKILLSCILAVVCVFSLVACASGRGATTIEPNDPLTGDSNVLVAYFSWSASHNTQTMAQYVADATGGELFRIYPETPYTTNYNDVIDIAQQERNRNARPALGEDISAEQFAQYDVIFIGYPIWWYDAPMIIYTFLEAHDFTGKTIVPFATSGGSGIAEKGKFESTTGATVLDGLCISGFSAGDRSRERVNTWVSNLGYMKSDSAQ